MKHELDKLLVACYNFNSLVQDPFLHSHFRSQEVWTDTMKREDSFLGGHDRVSLVIAQGDEEQGPGLEHTRYSSRKVVAAVDARVSDDVRLVMLQHSGFLE
jgi:hypothetical protein